MKRPRARRLAIAFGALAALACIGAIYEAVASARDRRHPPGRLIDVGGRRLHVLCIGSGSPTVVFEPASRTRAVSFEAVRTAIARQTRVCSYDRAGTGWSDDAPASVSVGDLTEDLRRVQENTPIQTPVVIVASSMGGWVAELYARRFPERVGGLVLLDAGNSETLASVNASLDRRTRLELAAACFGIRMARPLGVVRLLDSRPRVPGMLCAVVRGVRDTLAQFEQAPPLKADIPLVVLSAESADHLLPVIMPTSLQQSAAFTSLVGELRASHRHFAARSTRGSWRLVPGSGHVIAEDRPDVVVAAVAEVLRQLPR